MYQSYYVDMIYHGVHHFHWYNIHHKDFTKHPEMECSFWMDIRDIKKEVTLGKKSNDTAQDNQIPKEVSWICVVLGWNVPGR